MTQVAAPKTSLSLKGSVATVTEFLGFAVSSVLYQRGVYPSEDFKQVTKYGLQLMISNDPDLNRYMAEILGQIAAWLGEGVVRRFVLIVANPDTDDVLERWVFNVNIDDENAGGEQQQQQRRNPPPPPRGRGEEDVRKEIQALMRQITSASTFLPVLDGPCAFDLLVYTTNDVKVPKSTWEASEPRLIHDSEEVNLRAFSTGFHRVGTTVSYRD